MKIKIAIIIMSAFLSSISGSKGQNRNSIYPTEEFSVLEAKINGKPVVGSIDMAYKNYKFKKQYPWCLTINIGLELKNVTKDGLPTKSESDIANKFEDELLKAVGKVANVHYVGHIYNDTFLDVYVYLENPEKAHQYLQTQINKEGLT